jgi:FkbM family methyltransferase
LEYEEHFNKALLGSIRPSDQVWDIGANVGIYTKRFASISGPNGGVTAFEPNVSAAEQLRHNCRDLQTVSVESMALGEMSRDIDFYVSDIDADPTNSVVSYERRSEDVRKQRVTMVTADSYIDTHPGKTPNIIKIDVEGYELEVLQGMDKLLQSSNLRALFIEVHFSNLSHRGMRDAPATIVALLELAGFTVCWLDASHISATRKA